MHARIHNNQKEISRKNKHKNEQTRQYLEKENMFIETDQRLGFCSNYIDLKEIHRF